MALIEQKDTENVNPQIINRSIPLVSIIVIAYNSHNYILETLESIKAQTYKRIELIISDDYSIDQTVNLCVDWIEENKNRFERTKIVTTHKNTGIAANCNRGINASTGNWIKLIAGDDMLKNNCIDANLTFIDNNKNEEIRIIHSSMEYYLNSFTSSNFIKIRSLAKNIITDSKITPLLQHRLLLRGCFINSPSIFARKEIFTNLGGFDESLIIEDWPMWLRITGSGIKIHYFDIPTIKYRVRNDSLCNEKITDRIFNNHFIRERDIYKKYIFPYINIFEKIFLQLNFNRLFFLSNNFAKKNLINALISKLTTLPYWFYYNFYLKFYQYFIKQKIVRR
jgi:alpha-1,3-rhamnosyltransferase